jgi:hypothetical protein
MVESIGFFASLYNRVLLRTAEPSRRQIAFWDRYLVPLSRMTDRLAGYHFGKSVLIVWQQWLKAESRMLNLGHSADAGDDPFCGSGLSASSRLDPLPATLLLSPSADPSRRRNPAGPAGRGRKRMFPGPDILRGPNVALPMCLSSFLHYIRVWQKIAASSDIHISESLNGVLVRIFGIPRW